MHFPLSANNLLAQFIAYIPNSDLDFYMQFIILIRFSHLCCQIILTFRMERHREEHDEFAGLF